MAKPDAKDDASYESIKGIYESVMQTVQKAAGAGAGPGGGGGGDSEGAAPKRRRKKKKKPAVE